MGIAVRAKCVQLNQWTDCNHLKKPDTAVSEYVQREFLKMAVSRRVNTAMARIEYDYMSALFNI